MGLNEELREKVVLIPDRNAKRDKRIRELEQRVTRLESILLTQKERNYG